MLLLSVKSPEAPLEDSAPAEGGRGRELTRDMLAVLLGLGSLLVMLPAPSEPAGDKVSRESLGFGVGVIRPRRQAAPFKLHNLGSYRGIASGDDSFMLDTCARERTHFWATSNDPSTAECAERARQQFSLVASETNARWRVLRLSIAFPTSPVGEAAHLPDPSLFLFGHVKHAVFETPA